MHGVRRILLEQQAASIGLPLHTVALPEMPSMEAYEVLMEQSIGQLKQAGFTTAVFGDLFLEDLRAYRESQLQRMGVSCLFPLWKTDSHALLRQFIALGFKAIVVCVNSQYLDQSFCGRLIDAAFIRSLPAGVDVCGENGEYHSFVFDGPIFSQPVLFEKGEVVYREYATPRDPDDACFGTPQPPAGFYFLDLLPKTGYDDSGSLTTKD
jgi:uncharacterized protein (TIGR00290 family)